ncbi:MAG TPA: Crp/Fnr family transcriptional regulator [Gammaproteobacteria bacterium]|nr:Crp/Fnr family transcriptional regulator [Gammaproteobacteria bacterium]
MKLRHLQPLKEGVEMPVSLLSQVPIFSALSATELDSLAALTGRLQVKRGAVIVTEGTRADALYVVVAGRVRVFVTAEDGKEAVLAIEGPGASFGEIALLDGDPRSASVAAMEPTELLVISRGAFRGLLEQSPETATAVIGALAGMVRRLTNNVQSLALDSVYRRLVQRLEERAVAEGDIRVVPQRMTHQLLADMIGCSREMVSRIMSDLVKGGYVTVESDRLLINRKLPPQW